MRIPKRIGLVELFVDVKESSHSNLPATLMASIRRDANARRSDVLDILNAPRTAELDLIVFPGWTVVDTTLPTEIVQAARQRTVVIELLLPTRRNRSGGGKESGKVSSSKISSSKLPKGPGPASEQVPWHTYVIHRGKVLGPFVQRIITSGDAGSGNTPSKPMLEFANELKGGERTWSNGCALWICGEVNALYGRGDRVVPWVDNLPLDWAVVANPAHTPSRLQAMRDKRAHLSNSGILLTTANTHSSWQDSSGNQYNAGWRAAEVYRNGEPVGWDSERSRASSTFDVGQHRVVVVEWGQ
jgi:hypothetical protein